jgi:hypothetical protein
VDQKPARQTASVLDTRPTAFEELLPVDAGNLPSAFRPARPSWVLPLLRWGSLFVIGLVVFVGAIFVLQKLQIGGASQTDTARGSSLSLRVERNAGQLYLNWNRNASVISNVQKAVLIIMDGEQQQTVPLSLDELRTGGFVYSPGSSNVSFRLELTRRGDGGTVGESIRSVVSRPSALGTAVPPPSPAPPAAAAPKAAPPKAAAPVAQPAVTTPPVATQTEPALPAPAAEPSPS